MLESWNNGPTKSAIVDFVGRVITEGPDFVVPQDRIAVFDNDGTLWCEKPAYAQLDFLVRRLAVQAAADPSLAARQPYTAAVSGDLAWFGDAVTKHYQGDDSDLTVLATGVLSAHSGITVEEHAARVSAFFAEAHHPAASASRTTSGIQSQRTESGREDWTVRARARDGATTSCVASAAPPSPSAAARAGGDERCWTTIS